MMFFFRFIFRFLEDDIPIDLQDFMNLLIKIDLKIFCRMRK